MKNLSMLIWSFMALLASSQAWSQETPQDMLTKAEVLAFYSGSTLHSQFECQQALDSVDAWLAMIPETETGVRARMERIRVELLTGQDNSSENMNGLFPAFGGMTGQRTDYHTLDDASEALAEDLVTKLMQMPSHGRKGFYKESGVYLIVTTNNGNLGMVNVILDLLSQESVAYALRPHELSGVVPCSIEDGTCLQQLDSASWEGLLDRYETDDMLLLTVQEKPFVTDEIMYEGLLVQRYNRGQGSLTFEHYLEGFKTDKIQSRSDAIWLLLAGLLLSFLVQTAVGILDYSEGQFLLVDDWKTSLHAQKNVFAIAVSTVVVYVAIEGLAQIAPGLNEWVYNPVAFLWLAAFAVVPPLAAVVATFVLMWKLKKDWSVNEMSNYSRMIQAAFLASYCWMVFWQFISHPAAPMVESLVFLGLASVFTISPSWVMGQALSQLLGGSSRKGQVALSAVVALVSWALICCSILYEFADNHKASEELHLAGFALAVGYLFVLPKIQSRLRKNDREDVDCEYGFDNPKSVVGAGLNWDLAYKALDAWANSDKESPVFVMKGVVGAGKTRFLTEWKNRLDSRQTTQEEHRITHVLVGDFAKSLDESVGEFEPFIGAIKSHESTKNWDSIFQDKSQLANTLSDTAAMSAELMGISLPESEVDETRGVSDVASTLLSRCEVERKKGISIVMVFDNYSWATSDEKSRRLLVELVQRLDRMPSHKRPLKFILTLEEAASTLSGNEQLLNELTESGENAVTTWPQLLGWNVGSSANIQSSIETWLDALSQDQQWFNDGGALRLSKKMRLHLSTKGKDVLGDGTEPVDPIKAPSPGDFLNYLQRLSKGEFVQIQGQFIELVKDPHNSRIPLVQGEIVENAKRFDALNDEAKKLLISAAHVGFKFDAELLAEIWKMDLLVVLSVLDHPSVEGVFVRDQSSEDNIYSFLNRDLHLRVKDGFEQEESSRVRQMMVEFQKRVLSHLYQKGSKYLMAVDLEVLNSTAVDCINYVDVDSIRKQTSKTLLVAAYRNILVGKLNAAEVYLQSWVKLVLVRHQVPMDLHEDGLVHSDLHWLSRILTHLNESDKSLELIFGEKLHNKDGVHVRNSMRTTLNRLHFNGHESGGAVYLALLEESRLVLRKMAREGNVYAEIQQEWEVWQDSLENRWPYEAADLIRERDFILACRGAGDTAELERIVVAIPEGGEHELKGKILRNLASREGYDKSRDFALQSLQHQVDMMHLRDPGELVNEGNMMNWVEELHETFGSRKHDEGNHYCHMLGALLTNFGQQSDMKLTLSEFMILSGMKQGMKSTRNRGYSAKAEALIAQGKFEAAQKVLEEYGAALLNEGMPSSEFKFLLRGLLVLGKSNGEDYSAYFNLKTKMYESLRILSTSLKSEVGELFGQAMGKDEALPLPNELNEELRQAEISDVSSPEHQTNMVTDLLNLLARIAISDGSLDESEVHDLGETALACCIHLGVTSPQMVIDELNAWLMDWRGQVEKDQDAFLRDNVRDFVETAKKIDAECSVGEKRQVLRLCNIVAMADGVLEENEKQLLELAEEHIVLNP